MSQDEEDEQDAEGPYPNVLGDEAQAEVLARVGCVTADDWRRVWLSAIQPLPTALRPSHDWAPDTSHAVAQSPWPAVAMPPNRPDVHDDPRRFLLHVMNDPTIDWALRVEAAKALIR